MRGRGIGTARGRATIMRGTLFQLCDINGDNSFYFHSIYFCLFVSFPMMSSKRYVGFCVHGCPWLFSLPSELSDDRFCPSSSTWSWCRATSQGNSTLIIIAEEIRVLYDRIIPPTSTQQFFAGLDIKKILKSVYTRRFTSQKYVHHKCQRCSDIPQSMPNLPLKPYMIDSLQNIQILENSAIMIHMSFLSVGF